MVLNDRQSTKLQLAEALVGHLLERRIPCSSLATSTDLAHILAIRQPSILVLDYLLGETMTALDLIEHIREKQLLPATDIILWTDEPSIRVAVDAIRAGAKDFIEMTDGRHLSRILSAIERLHNSQVDPLRPSHTTAPSEPLKVPISHALRRSYTHAESIVASKHPILILLGERGSGRSMLAKHLHFQRDRAGVFTEIELDLWPHNAAQIVGDSARASQPYLLSHGATVLIDRAEFDSGELLTEIASRAQTINDPHSAHPTLLIVGTSSPDTARAWHRLTNAPIVDLPPFSERREDARALIEDLTSVTSPVGAFSPTTCSALLEMIMKAHWPGSFRQLAAALREMLYALPQHQADTSEVLSELQVAKERWERFSQPSMEVPPLERVHEALIRTDGNIRIAAAQLGVGVSQIRMAMGTSLTEHSHDQ